MVGSSCLLGEGGCDGEAVGGCGSQEGVAVAGEGEAGLAVLGVEGSALGEVIELLQGEAERRLGRRERHGRLLGHDLDVDAVGALELGGLAVSDGAAHGG